MSYGIFTCLAHRSYRPDAPRPLPSRGGGRATRAGRPPTIVLPPPPITTTPPHSRAPNLHSMAAVMRLQETYLRAVRPCQPSHPDQFFLNCGYSASHLYDTIQYTDVTASTTVLGWRTKFFLARREGRHRFRWQAPSRLPPMPTTRPQVGLHLSRIVDGEAELPAGTAEGRGMAGDLPGERFLISARFQGRAAAASRRKPRAQLRISDLHGQEEGGEGGGPGGNGGARGRRSDCFSKVANSQRNPFWH